MNKILNTELRKKYNPDGSDLRNYQLRLLEILKFIDKICNENNIQYWLSGGSCLGAVRHGGFIPWDDDIDIEMMEDDYQKFQNIMKGKPSEKYAFQDMTTDPNYYYSFGKVRDLNSIVYEISGCDKNYRYRGCFVDIFPIARSNSKILNKLGRYIGYKFARAAQSRNYQKFRVYKNLYKIIIPILRRLSLVGKSKTLRYNMGCPVFESFNINMFSEILLTSFEGCMIPIPKNYDSYLTVRYGNYQRIPNEKDIHIHLAKYELFN